MFHMSHVTCHMSLVTFVLLHVTCHISPVTRQPLYAASATMKVPGGLVIRLQEVVENPKKQDVKSKEKLCKNINKKGVTNGHLELKEYVV